MDRRCCFLCCENNWNDQLEVHHIYGGALRKKSDKYDLVVYLCGDKCHRNGKRAVHKCRETSEYIKKYGQLKYMKENNATKEDFMQQFYKNYLSDEEIELGEIMDSL